MPKMLGSVSNRARFFFLLLLLFTVGTLTSFESVQDIVMHDTTIDAELGEWIRYPLGHPGRDVTAQAKQSGFSEEGIYLCRFLL